MIKYKNIELLSFFTLSIFLIHFVYSFFVGDSYNLTRIVFSISLSIIAFVLVFKESNLILNIFMKQKILLIFLLIPFLQFSFSSYINSDAERILQLLVSSNYFLITLIILYMFYSSKDLSLKSFFKTIVFLNITIFSFLFLYYLMFMDIVDLMFVIKRFFTNIRYLNQLQTIFIPALLLFYSITKSKNIKIFALFLIFINFLFMFYTGGRGTLYSLVLASIFIFLISNSRIRKDIIYLTILLFVSYLIFQLSTSFFQDVSSHDKHFASFQGSGRVEIYTTLLTYILKLEHFFNAIGFASQDIALYGFLHPHNVVLFIFIGGGTIAVLLFIYLIFIYILKIKSKVLKKQSKIKIYFLYIFICFFIHTMVSGAYITPLSTLLFSYIFIHMNLVIFRKKILINYSNIVLKYSFKTLILLIAILNILYLYRAYNLIDKYKYTKEEIAKNNNVILLSPGILLYEHKIIQR